MSLEDFDDLEFDDGLLVEVVIEAAFGADPDGDLSGADWTELAGRVRGTAFWAAGRHGLGGQSDSAEMRVRLVNPDAALTPYHPGGQYYPHVRRTLPLRLSAAAAGDVPVEQVTCFLKSLRVSWDASIDDCVVDITARGRLDRLERSTAPVTSAIGTTVIASGAVAYWPLTDGEAAVTAASGLPGGPAMSRTGTLHFGTGDGGSGQPAILNIAEVPTDNGRLTGVVPAGTSTSSWRVEWVARWQHDADIGDVLGIVKWSTLSSVSSWQINYNDTNSRFDLQYQESDGDLITVTGANPDPYDGNLHRYRVTADQNGADIDVVFSVDAVEWISTTIVGATLGRVTQVQVNSTFSSGTQMPAIGHLTVWAPYGGGATDTDAAAIGYAGEMAGDRIQRLCDEAGIPVVVMPGVTSTMGPQQAKPLIDLLRECEAADGGLLHDAGPSGALVYQPRSARYNARTVLTIDATDRLEIAAGFGAVLDDRDLTNLVTVAQPQGSSGSFRDEASEDAEGTYPQQPTLNLGDDEDLDSHAAWRVGLGTVEQMTYDAVPVDLAQHPTLLAAWQASDKVGVRTDLTGLPEQHAPGTVEQFADGYTADCDGQQWRLFLDTVPAEPYEVIVLDTSSATLLTTVDADDTTWTTVVDQLPRWTTADEPFDVQCGGETPVEVTSVADVAITFVAAGTAAHANNASVTPGMPAGVQTGDLLLVWVAIRSSGTGTVNVPTGYTRMVGWHNATLLGKIHDGSESDPTITFAGGSAGDDTSAIMFAFRGTVADPAEALLDWADFLNTSAQNIAYPPLRAPQFDGCAILYLGWKQDDWTSVDTIAGAAEIGEPDTTTGNDQGIVADYVIQTTATAIAAGSFTVTGGATAISRGMVCAIAAGRSTLTVTRPDNGTAAAHNAGSTVQLADTPRVGL